MLRLKTGTRRVIPILLALFFFVSIFRNVCSLSHYINPDALVVHPDLATHVEIAL